MKLIVILAALAASALAACSECTGSLKDVGRECPATFDGTIQSWSCPDFQESIEVYACGGLNVVIPQIRAPTCTYDATSHALVGARLSSDLNNLCGDSFTKNAGRQPPDSCFSGGPTSQGTCNPP
jgi:hypothetical protein